MRHWIASVAVLLIRSPDVITTGADDAGREARWNRAVDLIQADVAGRGAGKRHRAVDAADRDRGLLNGDYRDRCWALSDPGPWRRVPPRRQRCSGLSAVTRLWSLALSAEAGPVPEESCVKIAGAAAST